MNVDAETRKRFKSITLEFSRNRKLNMATAYEALLDRYYSVSDVSEETGQQRVVRLLNRPSMMQFRYWYEKDNDIFQIERTRRTPRVYDKDTLVNQQDRCAIMRDTNKRLKQAVPSATVNQNPEQIDRDQIDTKLADDHFRSAHGGTK